MPQPSRKDECKCGLLARLAEDPKNSIEFDAGPNEYHIQRRGNGGYSLIHFCPFCGGRAPKSRRGSIPTQPKLVQQTKEFHASPGVKAPEPEPPIDTRKRYDVYCIEPNREIVVYRNARFKGAGALLPAPAVP